MNHQAIANKRNMTILFFTLVVIMLGFGMIIPIMPFYIEHFGASGQALGLLMAVFGTTQFLFAPMWGQASDHYGRKPILMIGVFGNVISQLMFGLSTQLWMLFVARALGGFLTSATFPTTMAYISDSTSEEDRGGGMGVLGAAMGMGMVFGPGIGGVLGHGSLSLPFFFAAGLSVIALGLIFFILPESLPPEKRTVQNSMRGPQFGEMWQAIWGPIGFLLFLALLLNFGLTNFESIFGLYALEKYGYNQLEVGYLLTFIGATAALVQGLLTGPLAKNFGEVMVIRGALLGCGLGFLWMLEAQTLPFILLSLCFFMVNNSLLSPNISSLISKKTINNQGTALGLNNSFMSLGRIIGPVWAGFAFDRNHAYPYLSGAVIMMIAFSISMVWLTNENN